MPDKKIQIRVEAEANVDAVKVLDTSLSNLEKHLDQINQKQEVLFVEPTAKLDAMLDRVAAARSGTGSLATKPPGAPSQAELDAIRLRGEPKPKITESVKEIETSGHSLYSVLRILGVYGYETLGRLGAKLAALAVAFRATKSAVEDFAASEQSLAKLDAALAATDQFSVKAHKAVVSLAQEMGRATGGTEKWVEAFQKLIQGGARVEELDKYATGLQNLSALIGGDVPRAAQVMEAAIKGNYDALHQFGIEAGDVGDKAESLDGILAELAAKGGAAASAEGETLTSVWKFFTSSLKDAGAVIGGLVSKMFDLKGIVAAAGIALTAFVEILKFLAKILGMDVTALENLQGALRGAEGRHKDAAQAAREHADAVEKLRVATENEKNELGEEGKRLAIVVNLERQKIQIEKDIELEKLKRDTIEHKDHAAMNDLKAAIIESKSKDKEISLRKAELDEEKRLRNRAVQEEEERQNHLKAIFEAAEREHHRRTLDNKRKTLSDEAAGIQEELNRTSLNPDGGTGLPGHRASLQKRMDEINIALERNHRLYAGLGDAKKDREIAAGYVTGNATEDDKHLKELRDQVHKGRIDLGGMKEKTAQENATTELQKSALEDQRAQERKLELQKQSTKKQEHLHELKIAAEEKYIHELDRQIQAEVAKGRDPTRLINLRKVYEQKLNKDRSPNEISRLDADEAADAKAKADQASAFKNSVDKRGHAVFTPDPTPRDNAAAIQKAAALTVLMQDRQAKALIDAFTMTANSALNATNQVKILELQYQHLTQPMSVRISYFHAALFIALAITSDYWLARVGFALLAVLWLLVIRNLRAQAARGHCAFCALHGAEVQAQRAVMDSDGNRWNLCNAHARASDLCNDAHAELFGQRVLAE
jgi:hypothetical protein